MKNFTDQELRDELQRREEEKKVANKPQRLNFINVSQLGDICQEYVDILDDNKEIGDLDHYIFEAAMEAVFGQNVWTWINKQKQ